MARFTLVVLLLTLALAPAVSAEPPTRGVSPFAGWLDVIWSYLDWMLPQKAGPYVVPAGSGAYIVPSGITATPRRHGAYIVPNGVQAAPRRHGAYIVPSGVRSAPRRHGAYIVPDGAQSAGPLVVPSGGIRGRNP